MNKNNEKVLEKIWNKEANSYTGAAQSSPDYLAHFEIMEETIGNLKGKKICDVGSGTGMTSAYLASKGAQLYLVDISQKALDFSKKYFRENKLSAKYYKQSAFEMDFPENYFDAVWNGGVIEHFSDEKKTEMMEKMWKITKPGGTLIICAPNARDLPFMAAKQLLIRRKKWAFGYEDDLTSSRISLLAKKAGIFNFRIFAYNPVVGWWFFPYGKEITDRMGLNTVAIHKRKTIFGHNIVFAAVKA